MATAGLSTSPLMEPARLTYLIDRHNDSEKSSFKDLE